MAKKRQGLLSGSVGGKPIAIDQTLEANAVLLHEIVETADDLDELFIYAANSDEADEKFVKVFHKDAEDNLTLITAAKIQPLQGQTLAVPGLIYAGGGSIVAIAEEAGKITISGWANNYDFGTENRGLAL